jgi:tRNA C32,U32 (ribose-2'-O)-methylase TrmJ
MAGDILRKAKVWPHLSEALREKSLVIGTTRRTGRLRGVIAQSVMLVAYELGRKSYEAASPVLVKQEELDALCKHIQDILHLLEYIPVEAEISRKR